MRYHDYDDVFFQGRRCQFISVDLHNLADYFGTAIAYYDSDQFPAIQLIWTDRENHYPWEDSFANEFRYKQPLLDRNAYFKFLEPENLEVFTTKQWMQDQSPILNVIHDEDGDWQFLTHENAQEEDIVLVELKHLIEQDLSLNALFDLQYGQAADRKFIGDEWVITELEDDDR